MKAASRRTYKEEHPQRVIESNKEYYGKSKEDYAKQIKKFRHECHGPIFTCICCMRDLFQRSVDELKGVIEQKILNENQMHGYLNFDESLKIKDEFHFQIDKGNVIMTKVKKMQEGYCLCKTCVTYLKRSQMPPMAFANSLQPAVIPDCLRNLTNLEKQLIVKNLIFIKIRQLPKTRMMAMNDRVINVPINDDNIARRVKSLPRTEENSGMINVGLKRKLNMKNYHKYGLINPVRVFKACEYLVNHHPDYKNIKLQKYEEWAKKCPSLFKQSESDEENQEKSSDENEETEKIGNENEKCQEEAESNDFNSTTCLYPRQPESNMIVNHSDETKKIKFQRKARKIYDLAPGQGQVPTNWIRDEKFDVIAFPELFPDGKGGINQERKVKITKGDFYSTRFLNNDKKYAKNSDYLFVAQQNIERHLLENNISISGQKGKVSKGADGAKKVACHNAFDVFSKIPGTPQYWKVYRNELFACLENLGPFTFFFTLSAAEKKWTEVCTAILHYEKKLTRLFMKRDGS